jgi:hypothetical protein
MKKSLKKRFKKAKPIPARSKKAPTAPAKSKTMTASLFVDERTGVTYLGVAYDSGASSPSMMWSTSESDGHRHLTGTGGQLQFVRGSYASNGGKSFMCLSSTYEKKGSRKSRIVLNLTPGNIVTTPRSDIMYIVTEYGMVNLKGKSVTDRAKALISIAHPDFREGLEREAYENKLIPRAFH